MKLIALGLLFLILGCASIPTPPAFEMDPETQINPLEQMHAAILEFRSSHGKLPGSLQELESGIKTVYSHSIYWDRFEVVADKNKKMGTYDLWAIEIVKFNPRVSVKLLNTESNTPFYSE